jgi:hypothetical protein
MTDNSDPFQPFKRFLDQFDTPGSSSVPGMGWPLSPMPVPGAGNAGTISPEASTKQTVKQLYNALAALSEHDSMASAGNVWAQYLDAFDVDVSAFGPEQLTAATLRTYRIWFFSLTQLLVESYTLRLVHNELVVEDHRSATGTQEWLWGLAQSDREQLLKRCTDVPDDLVGEMAALRRRRDELLYTFGGWDDVEFEESLADAQRSLEVLTALDDRVTAGSPFSYLSEVSGAKASQQPDEESESDDQGTANAAEEQPTDEPDA